VSLIVDERHMTGLRVVRSSRQLMQRAETSDVQQLIARQISDMNQFIHVRRSQTVQHRQTIAATSELIRSGIRDQ